MTTKAEERALAQKYVSLNRRARHDYFITSTVEAGLMLVGTEVKSLRKGQASIQEAFAAPKSGGIYLLNAYIPEYASAGEHLQHETRRPRQLLLHKREINKMLGAVKKEGMTLVPLGIFFNKRGIAKIEIGLAKGKQKHDKREATKKREFERDKARVMRERG